MLLTVNTPALVTDGAVNVIVITPAAHAAVAASPLVPVTDGGVAASQTQPAGYVMVSVEPPANWAGPDSVITRLVPRASKVAAAEVPTQIVPEACCVTVAAANTVCVIRPTESSIAATTARPFHVCFLI